ncbi:MAG: type II secretion system major pseudopilin GspG [Deltaproteobacteria bacterium]|nr:type II secretion system major pseudopilin GspG [Deltaproteobacteria bacterium]MBW1817303.1 type II secretion system major pseudopilin GspG [Deltaproteobacteria bacterium]MBW2284314.1 type II secretion system major pseudopilin GspG [Deltaproteobacteria bacterium]
MRLRTFFKSDQSISPVPCALSPAPLISAAVPRDEDNASIKTFQPASARGFTLIELMVVIVILGVLAGLIVPRIMGRPEEAKQTKARIQMESLETALKLYKLDNGTYPSTEQGLEALVEPPTVGELPRAWRQGGYLEKGKIPKDPWRNPYIYLSPGIHGDFDLVSYGSDGQPEGEGKNRDIRNWEFE